MSLNAVRAPDAVDAARTAALALLATALVGTLGKAGLPAPLRLLLIQLCFLAVPLAYAKAVGLRPLADAGFGRPRWRDLALTAVATMASLWILKGLQDLQLDVFRHFGREEVALREREQIERTMDRAREVGGLLGLSLLAVIPPLCEEVLFRGLVLRGLGRTFGALAGIGGTAVFFAAMHGKETQFVLMLFLGLYFGALARLTGSLWPPILAHALNNAAVVALQAGWGPQAQDFRPPWPLLLLSVFVFAGVLVLLGLDRRRAAQPFFGSPGA